MAVKDHVAGPKHASSAERHQTSAPSGRPLDAELAKGTAPAVILQPVSLKPELFINRELSLIEFNARVLEESFDERNPLLERVRFLYHFCSNLDEFFMIRVSGIREQVKAGISDRSPDGMTP